MKEFWLHTLPESNNLKELLSEASQPGNIIERDFPLLYRTVNFEQNKHHGEDLWTHLSSCYLYALGYTSNPVFSFAALLHDIGKVTTRKWDEEKQDYTFHGHDVAVLEPITNYLSSWQFSKEDIERIILIVRHHLYRFYPDTKNSTIRQWLGLIGRQGWQDLQLMRIVDRQSNLSNKDKPILTKEFKELQERIIGIISTGTVFLEDLDITRLEIENLIVGEREDRFISREELWPVVMDCLNLTYQKPSKNTREQLKEFIRCRK